MPRASTVREPVGGTRPRSAVDAAVDGDDDLDLVVVGDDAEAVLGLEPVDRLDDRLLGEPELVLAAHRARAVEDEREVDGRATPGRVRGDGGRDDVDEQEALAAGVGADERAGRGGR